MTRIGILFIALTALLAGCAQVPKESVELSTTVGRDVSEMKRSHLALVDLYYKGLMRDINDFVDKVYLPYQIQRTLSDDLWKREMLSAIESASRPDTTGARQIESFQKIEAFLLIIQEEVESYRKLKLQPIKDQYDSVRAGISDAYDQIHYANAIVTGHLASVVKVHDAQSELLEKLDLKNLRTETGEGVAGLSEKIGALVQKAKSGEEKLDSAVAKFDQLVKGKQ